MARRKRQKRTSEPVYFFVVEGDTEENYIKLLKRLYRKPGQIYNCDGGNARTVLKQTLAQIAAHQKFGGANDYSGYVVWFDDDAFETSDREEREKVEAHERVSDVFVSCPCVENWLLAHFQRPCSPQRQCSDCETALRKHIPHYHKSSLSILETHIDKEKVEAAMGHMSALADLPGTYFGA